MRILCVHQGYELYGSDRAFIDSIGTMREAWPSADIDVLLPREGPIVTPLRAYASSIAVEPLFVLRRRNVSKLLKGEAMRLAPAVACAARRMRCADLVYVNTVVNLDYLLAARLFRAKTVVHVHEIPEGFALPMFRALLRLSGAAVIFNSNATRAAYRLPATQKQHVIYNGVLVPASMRPSGYDGARRLRVLLLGRISRIKGQDLLVEAIAALPRELSRRLDIRIVGESFGQDLARETALRRQVAQAGLAPIIQFEPFQSDPSSLYAWADIVVVPSRRPESLGRVAIEAMAHGRPALVAGLGGLVEVVEDGVSGWIVPPNDVSALARKLADIVREPQSWRTFAGAARARCDALFSLPTISRQLQAILQDVLARRPEARAAPGLART